MKREQSLLAATWGSLSATLLFSQQAAFPKKPSEVIAPASGVVMHREYAKAIGWIAYIWG